VYHQLSTYFWWTLDECVLGGLRRVDLERCSHIPGQQILDLADGDLPPENSAI